MSQAMKAPFAAIISGVAWTVIAALILRSPEFWGRLHEPRWLACLAGPFIGLALYYGSRWSYRKETEVRVVWAVASLYLAAGIYGLALGLLAQTLPGTHPATGGIWGPPWIFWCGLTMAPVFWPLFALSFLNHQFLRRYEERA